MTPGADERGGTASPSVPYVTVTTAGVDPAVRTRSPAGPRGRHVTTPEAAQRPAPPGAMATPSAMATWRCEQQTVSVWLPCRRASRGPERPEPATSARLGELVGARSDRSPRRPLDLKSPGRAHGPGTRSGEGGPGSRGPGPGRRAARRDNPAAARRARGAEIGRPAGRPEKAKVH
jgi:hypothetical protein